MAPTGAAYCRAHVEDTVRAHILVMEEGKPAKATSPPGLVRGIASVMDVVEAIVPLPPDYTSGSLRSMAVTFLASNQKTKREPSFTPRPLEDGLRETLQYEQALLGQRP